MCLWRIESTVSIYIHYQPKNCNSFRNVSFVCVVSLGQINIILKMCSCYFQREILLNHSCRKKLNGGRYLKIAIFILKKNWTNKSNYNISNAGTLALLILKLIWWYFWSTSLECREGLEGLIFLSASQWHCSIYQT